MLQKVEGKKMYEEVVQQIRQMIINGELQKGDMLPPEKELANQTGVSRVTVREALRLLSEMGLIEIRRGVGSFVCVDTNRESVTNKIDIYLGEFKNNFEQAIAVKRIIDPQIAKEAAFIATSDDIAKLEAAMKLTIDHKYLNKEYDEACSALHIAIVAIVKLPLLTEIYYQLEKTENTTPRFQLSTPNNLMEIKEQDIAQHQKIITAIKNHQQDYAQLYTLEHLDFISSCYEKYFKFFY